MTYQMPSPEIPGWMSADELEWLFQAARRHIHIAEIGCWMGRSTHALASGQRDAFRARAIAMEDQSPWCGSLVCVDTFEGTPSELDSTHAFAKDGDVFAEFKKNTAGLDNVMVLRRDSIAACVGFLDDTFGMIFIDADHSYGAVLADLRAWWPKLKEGGLFCGHDINEPGVIKALKEFSAEIGREVVREVGIIWSIR